jgi:hypothetical protein
VPLNSEYKIPSVEIEFLLEFVNTSAGVDKLLLAGEERMAFRAYINLDIVLYGLGNIFCTASTLYGSGLVIGMDTLLHRENPLFHIVNERCSNISQIAVYHRFEQNAIPFFGFFVFRCKSGAPPRGRRQNKGIDFHGE